MANGTSRRTLLKSIAAGGGVVIAGKNLPDAWKKPVVNSVILPAHAQTSPTDPPDSPDPSCTGTFSETLGYDVAQDEFGTSEIPDQSFAYTLSGAEPCGDGTVSITNLQGDLQDPDTEQWTIWLGAIGSGVNLGQTNNASGGCEAAPGSTFPVTLAQLQAAISGDNIVIEAENGGSISDNCPTNTMDVTLEFPVLS